MSENRTHFPEMRNGCYYLRPADCCWLCYLRIVGCSVRRVVAPDD